MFEKIEEMYQEFLSYKFKTQCEDFSYKGMCENFYRKGYRKESDTAREILTELVKRAEKISFFDCRMGLDLDELAEKYGVDLGE